VLLAFTAFFAILLVHPLAASFRTESGVILHAWQTRQLYTVFPFLIIALLVATAFVWRWMGRQLLVCPRSGARVLIALRPLLALPAIAFGAYLAPWIGLTASGLILPYGVTLIAAWVLENLLGDSVGAASARRPRLLPWTVLVYGVFIFVAGLHFQKEVGQRSGDEIHYLTQLESLVDDGNLELSDEMAPVIAERGRACIAYSHIVENAEGKLYSYHAFGLPLLAWPFGYLGVVGRQLFLAIIAAFAVAGCRAACLAAKAPPRAAAVVTWALAFSYIWVMYSTRFLPEILGCGLLAWGCWALAAQEDRRWTATLVAAVCCGILPYAHVRWAPPSLVIAAFFGFEGLLMRGERLRAKFLRLFVFAMIYMVFGLTLLYIHGTLFSGSQAYDYEKVLLSYPQAMWGMFTDQRGLLGLLPVLLIFVVALPFCLMQGRKAALRATESAAVFFTILLTSCTTSAALSGACIPGRYLLTAIPALLPPAALVLGRCRRPARIWVYFLALMPVLYFAYVGSWITGSSDSFFRVPEKLRGYIGFHTYWEPLTSYLQNVNLASIGYASAFVGLLMVFTALLIAGHRKPRLTGVLAVLVFTAALSCGFISDQYGSRPTGKQIFLLTKAVSWHYFFRDEPAPELFATLVGVHPGRQTPSVILSDRLKTPEDPASFVQVQNIPPNDWDGRGIRWQVIRPTQIRHNFDGYFAFRVVGCVNRGTARFVVRQGAFSIGEELELGEGPFDFTWLVRTRKNSGFTNTIMSLKDDVGEVTVDYFHLAPFSPYMVDSGFTFPPTTQIYNLTQ